MKALNNLLKKNLLFNKSRTIVTIISIILSGALICGVATLIVSFQQFIINVLIETDGNYHATINNVLLDKQEDISNNKYIKTTMASIEVGYAKLNHINIGDRPYLFVLAYDNSMFGNRPVKLISGHIPKNGNEIIISDSVINDGGMKYKIGDTISIDVGKRFPAGSYYEQEEGFRQDIPYMNDNEILVTKNTFEYKIVGIFETLRSESSLAPGYTVITNIDEKYINETTKAEISVIMKNPKNIFNKMNEIGKLLQFPTKEDGTYDIDYNSQLLRWYGVIASDTAMTMLYTIGLVLILVIMIASIIVIYNSFNISITERKKQLGMLASIGTNSKQIRRMVIKEGAILGSIGIPIGILSGILGIGITLQVINHLNIFGNQITTKLHLATSWLAILVTILFGGLTIFISSLIPAIKASRTSPIEAIRLSSDIKIKSKKLRTSKLVRRLFGIEGELGLKNMKRNRRKYRSTIISIFVSIVLFMTVNGFAEYSLRSSMKLYQNYNFNVGVTAPDTFYQKVTKLNNIKRYAIVHSLIVNINMDEKDINKKIIDQLQGFKNQTTGKYQLKLELFTLGDNEFNYFIEENKENINDYNNLSNPTILLLKNTKYFLSNIGKFYDLSLINIKEGNGLDVFDDNAKVNSLKVGKLTTIAPTGFSNINAPLGTMYGFISNKLYDSFNNNLKTEQNFMAIKSSKPEQLTKDIKGLTTSLDTDIMVQNIDEAVKQLKNVMLAISIFLYGFIVLVALIAITNIINTITTSMYLRRSEFATIRAIGMTDKSFRTMIRYESIFYGFKALIYGLTAGTLIDYLLFKKIGTIFVYDYVLPIKAILICVIFVFIIISITMAYAVNKIKNDNIIDVIRNENV
jgi:putative ABC transport system permease protein